MIPAVLVMGPTAAGKSAVALALAKRIDGEIVSVDSAQVYRGMDVGTAKPDATTRAAIAHHLIDIIDPDETYSAAQFRRDALQAIAAIRSRGRVPIVAGGTMLYFKALREGLSRLPQADPTVRATLDARAARDGWPALHAELARVDAKTAQRVAPNDQQRIQRALEVWRLTGKPLSSLQGMAKTDLPFRLKAFALMPPERSVLHQRIEQRFDAMLEAGIVDELKGLRGRFRLSAGMPSMRCVGYRQAWEHLDGKSDKATMRSRALAATRQLAKRQITWLRSFGAAVRSFPDERAALDPLLREIG